MALSRRPFNRSSVTVRMPKAGRWLSLTLISMPCRKHYFRTMSSKRPLPPCHSSSVRLGIDEIRELAHFGLANKESSYRRLVDNKVALQVGPKHAAGWDTRRDFYCHHPAVRRHFFCFSMLDNTPLPEQARLNWCREFQEPQGRVLLPASQLSASLWGHILIFGLNCRHLRMSWRKTRKEKQEWGKSLVEFSFDEP